MNEFELDFIKKRNLQFFLYSKKEREKKMKEKKNNSMSMLNIYQLKKFKHFQDLLKLDEISSRSNYIIVNYKKENIDNSNEIKINRAFSSIEKKIINNKNNYKNLSKSKFLNVKEIIENEKKNLNKKLKFNENKNNFLKNKLLNLDDKMKFEIYENEKKNIIKKNKENFRKYEIKKYSNYLKLIKFTNLKCKKINNEMKNLFEKILETFDKNYNQIKF